MTDNAFGGEGTLAGHLTAPATGKTTWSAPAPVFSRLTDIEASGCPNVFVNPRAV